MLLHTIFGRRYLADGGLGIAFRKTIFQSGQKTKEEWFYYVKPIARYVPGEIQKLSYELFSEKWHRHFMYMASPRHKVDDGWLDHCVSLDDWMWK